MVPGGGNGWSKSKLEGGVGQVGGGAEGQEPDAPGDFIYFF